MNVLRREWTRAIGGQQESECRWNRRREEKPGRKRGWAGGLWATLMLRLLVSSNRAVAASWCHNVDIDFMRSLDGAKFYLIACQPYCLWNMDPAYSWFTLPPIDGSMQQLDFEVVHQHRMLSWFKNIVMTYTVDDKMGMGQICWGTFDVQTQQTMTIHSRPLCEKFLSSTNSIWRPRDSCQVLLYWLSTMNMEESDLVNVVEKN